MLKRYLLDLDVKYTRDDVIHHPLPGANTLMGHVFGSFDFTTIPEEFLERARIRGAEIHEAIEERILHGKELYEVYDNFEYEPYYRYFMKWEKEFDPTYLFAELPFVHEERGYKGIIDCLAQIEGKLVLIDWKTASNPDRFKGQMQQSLYALALEELYDIKVDEIRILSFNKSGYKFIRFDYDKNDVLAMIQLYQTRKKVEGFEK